MKLPVIIDARKWFGGGRPVINHYNTCLSENWGISDLERLYEHMEISYQQTEDPRFEDVMMCIDEVQDTINKKSELDLFINTIDAVWGYAQPWIDLSNKLLAVQQQRRWKVLQWAACSYNKSIDLFTHRIDSKWKLTGKYALTEHDGKIHVCRNDWPIEWILLDYYLFHGQITVKDLYEHSL